MAEVKTKVTSKDKGYKAALKRYSAMGSKLQVGVPSDGTMHSGGDMTIADLATIHEFGLGVPERSFLRAWFDGNQGRIRKMISLMQQSVATGKRTQEQALALLGQKWVSEIQVRMSANIPPPLKPATIQRKGSSIALIDTGQLRSAITYIIQLANGPKQQAPAKTQPGAGRARGRRRQ